MEVDKILFSKKESFKYLLGYNDDNIIRLLCIKLPQMSRYVNTNFQGKKIPKVNAWYKCLSLIILDSVIRVSKK